MASLDVSGTNVPGLAELITHEHRLVDGLVAALGTDRDDRFPLAHRLVDEMAAHISSVTQVLLPALRDVVPGGAEMANQAQSLFQEMREALAALEDGYPGDPGFESALETLAGLLRRHVPVEENEQLPALSTVIGPDAMGQLGLLYGQVKENTPSGLQAMPVADRNPRFRSEP